MPSWRNPLDRVDAFAIDEIGKMELHCDPFVHAVRRLLDGDVPVIATVSLKGPGPIVEAKARPDVNLLHVNAENRDELPQTLANWLRSMVA